MIYCITARELGLVKIGFSENPFVRFSKMQSDSPVALRIERVTAGEVADEQKLHQAYAEHRVRGEWFTITPAIETWMASLPAAMRTERETPVKDLCEAVGISRSYGSMILSGRQKPSRPLAIHILRTTGWRHPVIAELSDAQIDTLEAVDPWTRTTSGVAA